MKRKLPSNEILVQEYEGGLSADAIAQKYGVTHGAVLYNLKNAGCKMRDLSEAHKLGYKTGRKKVSVKSGADHYLWKGGKENRDYRKKIKKEICANCGSSDNLGIHHIDFDHYNNLESNLQVLCVSCHMSLHKQAYWDAIHSGRIQKKSNGRAGWEHGTR